MEEQAACAHCGEHFPVSFRAGALHRCCRRPECQRERRRLAQRLRRAKHGGPRPSQAGQRSRAAYMRAYRARNPSYVERDRLARRQRRIRARGDSAGQAAGGGAAAAGGAGAVTEAGLPRGVPAQVYVVVAPHGQIRLRVVTADGRAVTLEPAVGWEKPARAVTEAGLGP